MSEVETATSPIDVVSTNKGYVVEHTAVLAGELAGVTVVKLDMVELGETRWRLRTSSGLEARVTEAKKRHVQETRRRNAPGIYALDNGWMACITLDEKGELRTDMAFAGSNRFYLKVPPAIDYVLVLSDNIVFAFFSNDKSASSPVKDNLYEAVVGLTDENILELFAHSSGYALDAVDGMRDNSF